MFPSEPELGALAAAYAELVYPAVAENIVSSAYHTRVGQRRSEVILPQIGVRVKMDYVHIRESLGQHPHRSERHKVLPAEH